MSRSSRTFKALAGTLRPDRLRTGGGIAPLKQLPRAPRGLSAEARDAWQAVGIRAVGLGTLTTHDLVLLEETARTVATCRSLEESLARDGVILVSGSGAKKAHPALQALASSRALFLRQLGQFGLTPMSRETLSLDPMDEPKGNPFDEFKDPPARKPVTIAALLKRPAQGPEISELRAGVRNETR